MASIDADGNLKHESRWRKTLRSIDVDATEPSGASPSAKARALIDKSMKPLQHSEKVVRAKDVLSPSHVRKQLLQNPVRRAQNNKAGREATEGALQPHGAAAAEDQDDPLGSQALIVNEGGYDEFVFSESAPLDPMQDSLPAIGATQSRSAPGFRRHSAPVTGGLNPNGYQPRGAHRRTSVPMLYGKKAMPVKEAEKSPPSADDASETLLARRKSSAVSIVSPSGSVFNSAQSRMDPFTSMANIADTGETSTYQANDSTYALSPSTYGPSRSAYGTPQSTYGTPQSAYGTAEAGGLFEQVRASMYGLDTNTAMPEAVERGDSDMGVDSDILVNGVGNPEADANGGAPQFSRSPGSYYIGDNLSPKEEEGLEDSHTAPRLVPTYSTVDRMAPQPYRGPSGDSHFRPGRRAAPAMTSTASWRYPETREGSLARTATNSNAISIHEDKMHGTSARENDFTVVDAPPSATRPERQAYSPFTPPSQPVGLTAEESGGSYQEDEDHITNTVTRPSALSVFRRTILTSKFVSSLRAPLSSKLREASDSDDDDEEDEDGNDMDPESFYRERGVSGGGTEAGEPRLQRTQGLVPSKWAYVTKFANQLQEARQSKLQQLGRGRTWASGKFNSAVAPSLFRPVRAKGSELEYGDESDEEVVELSQVFDENGNPMMEPTLSHLWSENRSTSVSSSSVDGSGLENDMDAYGTEVAPQEPANGGHARMVRPAVNAQRYTQQQQFMRANVLHAMRHQQQQQQQQQYMAHQQRRKQRHLARQQQYQQQRRQMQVMQASPHTMPSPHYASSPAKLVQSPSVNMVMPAPPPALPPTPSAPVTPRAVQRLQGPAAGERMTKANRPMRIAGVKTYIAFTPRQPPPEPQPDLRGPKLRSKPRGADFERLYGVSLRKARWVDSPPRSRTSAQRRGSSTRAPQKMSKSRAAHARPRAPSTNTDRPASRPSSAASNGSKDSRRAHRRKAK